MLEGLICSKSYFLDFAKSCLVKNHLSLRKLSGFYKSSSGTSTYLGVVLNKCKRRLRKYFEVRNSALHRQSLWRESKSPKRDFLFESEAVASKFSSGETLVLSSRKSKEVETSLVYLTPSGVWKDHSPFGLVPKGGGGAPKCSEAFGLQPWAFIPESTSRLSSKIPCAKIKSDDLSSYVP